MDTRYDQTNIFNRIINKDIPAKIILEDDKCISFADINPQAKLHLLILPKLQCLDFQDFMDKESDVGYLFRFITQVVEKLGITDYQLKTNKGAKAGQEIFHFHIHLLSDVHIA